MATAVEFKLAESEAIYMKGGKEPVTSSVLISNSKYLNNPLFRDLYAQMGLKRDGHDLPAAFLIPEINRAFGEVIDVPRLMEMLESEKKRIPEFGDWIDSRFVSDLSIETVKGYAAGTLGRRIHDFIEETGYQLDFMFTGEPRNDYEYMNKRRVQVHDIEHMVTGLDPSPVGEMGLVTAHMIANMNYFELEFAAEISRHGMFLCSTSMMRAACHYPVILPAYFESLAMGRALGAKQKKPIFMIRWEDYYDWQIADIREEFSFQDGPPDGHWQWTFDASTG
ncbi:Coq4 family protein [Flavisphingomonas formosensis]|uniref:Coq4 family protein n=1 Tax=Flavisphingomonas formosensis TaxID=861534 RepID=UPI0012F99F16|nr:Coq4 family protein [Sphingomonas formosensis]